MIPLDVASMDAAQAAGQLLREVAPSSPARVALGELAARVAGRPAPRDVDRSPARH